MSNIIDFPAKDDFDFTSYTQCGNDIGVSINSGGLEIICVNKDLFSVSMEHGNQLFNRGELSEFLWVAATLLDSERRRHPKLEMIGMNY